MPWLSITEPGNRVWQKVCKNMLTALDNEDSCFSLAQEGWEGEKRPLHLSDHPGRAQVLQGLLVIVEQFLQHRFRMLPQQGRRHGIGQWGI